MDRWACVDLAALPLQLLLRSHPEWAEHPTVVVAEDTPQGEVLWQNGRAHTARVRTGMRYAEALSLVSTLRAGVVPPDAIANAVAEVTDVLRRFSQAVEPCTWPGEPGVFWLNASGLGRLHPSLADWARQIAGALDDIRLAPSVVIGFDRFCSYALARQLSSCGKESTLVLPTAAAERERAGAVPLDLLELDAALRDDLERLGIDDVAGMVRLPAGALMERFGRASYELRRLMGGELVAPLAPVAAAEATRASYEVDPEDRSLDRQALLFLVKQCLGELEQQLRQRGEVFAALVLRCELDDGVPAHTERIVPAAPTRDAVQLVDLVRLRLEPVTFTAPLLGFELTAETAVLRRAQGELFVERCKRDLAAADRALARLRAEFGDGAVQRAVLRDGHLPEARFVWQALQNLPRGERVDPDGASAATFADADTTP
ncbi:MAG: DNA polymerase Y family protein, partial [Planctomycetes bacterium]|nr:DNA polymerase Y family protein [Planctomycetota bacterium]